MAEGTSRAWQSGDSEMAIILSDKNFHQFTLSDPMTSSLVPPSSTMPLRLLPTPRNAEQQRHERVEELAACRDPSV